MASTIHRFERGVHTDNRCGSNRHGLSSINSLPPSTDFHILNSMYMNRSPIENHYIPKIKFTSSDTLIYMASKVIRQEDQYDTYVLLLRERTFLSNTLQKIIVSISMKATLVFTIIPDGTSYHIRSYFNGRKSVVIADNTEKLKKTMKTMNAGRSSMYIVYPELTELYKILLGSFKDCSWCIPASPSHLYVSSIDRYSYDHFAYPWSRSSSCKGYTIGHGPIRPASTREQRNYIGAFAYYERTISCTPYKTICPDCYEMKRMATFIRDLTAPGNGDTIVDMSEYDRRSSSISASSIVALDELRRMIDSYHV